MAKFRSKIYVLGINPVVDPPERVLRSLFAEAGKDKGPIPVRGTIDSTEFVQTLVKYAGSWRLYINGVMLKASGAGVGDTVTITIEVDRQPREIPVPEALASALKHDPKAKAAFDSLAPSRRKEILRYIGSLKSQAAMSKNVERVIAHLSGISDDAPVFMRKGK